MLAPLVRRAAALLFCLSVIGGAVAAADPASAAPGSPGGGCGGTLIAKSTGGYWRCTFDDEFNGTQLDTTKWNVTETAGQGYHQGPECFVNSPNNVSVSGGQLNLTVRKENAPFTCKDPLGNYSTSYTSGAVSTYNKFTQTYGRFEARAAFPAATVAGLQTSLWIYPENSTLFGTWPASGEIDFAEQYSVLPDRVIPYIHYVQKSPDYYVTNNRCMVSNVSAMHTYTAVWTATSITISIDGTTCVQDVWQPAPPLLAPAPFNQPFFLALTQALGISTNAFSPTNTPLPATSHIDYVRAWA